jgi:ubiquitin-small subunit ribosomal protein S27Ae
MAKKKSAPAKKDSAQEKTKAVKKSQKISAVYDISGTNLTRKNKSCPKCGAGVFLAEHSDRRSCGKCNYSERK